MIMNSYAQHFMTYEFMYEFMYMKNIVKLYLKSCVPRFQMGSRRSRKVIPSDSHGDRDSTAASKDAAAAAAPRAYSLQGRLGL